MKLFKVFILTCADEWLESNHWYQWFLVWQTIGSDGFPMVFLLETMFFQWFWSGQPLVPMGFSMVFPLETMVFQWFWVWQTIGTNGFSMVFPLETMVFQWFPMVANHWSNDGMVTIHRRGLPPAKSGAFKSLHLKNSHDHSFWFTFGTTCNHRSPSNLSEKIP